MNCPSPRLISREAPAMCSPVDPVRRFLALVTVAIRAPSSAASMGVPFLELMILYGYGEGKWQSTSARDKGKIETKNVRS